MLPLSGAATVISWVASPTAAGTREAERGRCGGAGGRTGGGRTGGGAAVAMARRRRSAGGDSDGADRCPGDGGLGLRGQRGVLAGVTVLVTVTGAVLVGGGARPRWPRSARVRGGQPARRQWDCSARAAVVKRLRVGGGAAGARGARERQQRRRCRHPDPSSHPVNGSHPAIAADPPFGRLPGSRTPSVAPSEGSERAASGVRGRAGVVEPAGLSGPAARPAAADGGGHRAPARPSVARRPARR